jgi:predicted regulator of Ras-like GTPase activity (Roadblock/LC7/MglB family)
MTHPTTVQAADERQDAFKRSTEGDRELFSSLLDAFADQVPHVVHAAAATSDGLPLAATRNVEPDNRDQLCASISSTMAVLETTAKLLGGGGVINHLTNMDAGSAIFQRARNGLVLFMVMVEEQFDPAQVQFQLELLGDRIGEILNPGQRGVPAATVPQQRPYPR